MIGLRTRLKKLKELKEFKKKGAFFHKPLELRCPQYISLKGKIYLGEGCILLCWDTYTSGKKLQPLQPTLIIGNDFHASRNFIVQCAGCISIGENVLVGSDVFIIDYNHGLDAYSVSYLDNLLDVKSVKIGDGCWIGNSSIILPGVSLGKKCIVAAGSVVTHSFPDYCMVAGNPAKIIKNFNSINGTWEAVLVKGEADGENT